MAFKDAGHLGCQEEKIILNSLRQHVQGHARRPGRGQFYRQRAAFYQAADLDDAVQYIGCQLEAAREALDPLNEQAHTAILLSLRISRVIWHRQAVHAHHVSSLEVEEVPCGDQYGHPGGIGDDIEDEFGGGREMLEAV